MGHKVHPLSFRLPVTHRWSGVWFANKQFSVFLREDARLRSWLRRQLKEANVDDITMERSRQNLTVNIRAGKPGVIIGRAGAGIEELKKKMMKEFFRGRRFGLNINVKEVERPSLSAHIVGQQIALDLEKRLPFRRAMKVAIERVLKAGALGVKLTVSGRLNGADIARTETLAKGKIPLHNLRADVDFTRVAAHTVYGAIGVKVWINRGEIFTK